MDSSHNNSAGVPPAKHSSVRLILIVAAIAFIALFALGELPKIHNATRLSALAQEVSAGITDVTVVTPKREKPSDLTLPGSVQAITEAVINARTSGYIKKRFVDIGSKVHAGDLLAIIESPDLDQQVYQAVAQTDQTKATVRQSQADVARQLAGVAQAESAIAQQRAAVRLAEAGLTSAESKLVQANANVAQTTAQLGHTVQTLAQQRAILKQADSQLSLAKVTNARYQDLVKQGFDTQQNADQASAAVTNASAAVASANAAIAAAQADVEAAKQAVNASKAGVVTAQSDVASAKDSVEAAKAVLNSAIAASHAAAASVSVSRSTVQANQAAVSSSKANAEHYAALKSFERVVAPFDGVITSRTVDEGALVTAGGGSSVGSSNSTTPSNGLFGIARTNTLRIMVNMPQTFVDFVHPGVPALVMISERPGKPIRASVFQSSGALDSASRTLLTEVHIDNADNSLRPGMYAQVRFHNPRTKPAITVPANTLIINAKGIRLATVVDGKVHFVDIKTGRDLGSTVEVVQGLKGKEQVVTNPNDDLQEGTEVRPVVEQAPEKKP